MSTYSSITTRVIVTETETADEVVVSEENNVLESKNIDIFAVIGTILPVFIISNIPTIILLAIYFASREKLNIKSQLDKMNIQDLE